MGALPNVASAKPKAPRKVLLFSKTNGFRHGSIPVGVLSLTKLGEKTGAFEVTASEDESVFEKESLQGFDAVIMLNTTGEVFRPKDWPADPAEKEKAAAREAGLKQNLLEFVRQGKGLAGIHSATDTYKSWKEYNDMMGGAFVSHPWHEKVAIRNMDPQSPVNAAFASGGGCCFRWIRRWIYRRESARMICMRSVGSIPMGADGSTTARSVIVTRSSGMKRF